MDSVSADLTRGLETSHHTAYDRERFFASLVSGHVDEAEEYLSDFTKLDSNCYSNLMFYLVKRQRYFKFLVERPRESSTDDLPVITLWDVEYVNTRNGGVYEVEEAKINGYTFDILPVAKSFKGEMFTMMNQLIPMNPDLHKEVDISSQMQTLHLQDDKTTMLGVAGPAVVAFNGGEMNKDK